MLMSPPPSWSICRFALALWLPVVGVFCASAQADRPPDCFAPLSLAGTAGLLDTPSASAGCSFKLRTALHVSGFSENSYLLAGDHFRLVAGGLSAAATLGKNIEVAFAAGLRLGHAEWAQTPLGSASPLFMAHLGWQLKLHAPVGAAHVALLPAVRFPTGGQDFVPAPRQIDVSVDALAEVYLDRFWPKVPLTLHGLFGYVHDRSLRALDSHDCLGGTVADCVQDRLQSTAAYGVGMPRLRAVVGASFRASLKRGFSIVPAALYRAELVVGEGDPVLQAQFLAQFPAAPAAGRWQQTLTLGTRVFLSLPLAFDIGVRLALQHAGYAMGTKQPVVLGFGSLSWETDLWPQKTPAQPTAHRVAPETPGVDKTCEAVGQVVESESGQPLSEVVVRGLSKNALLTDEQGRFYGSGLPCGAVQVAANRGDQKTGRVSVVLTAGVATHLTLRLPRPERTQGELWVQVQTPEAQGALLPLQAFLLRTDPAQRLELAPKPHPNLTKTGFFVRAPVGVWHLRIEALGFLSREQTVVVAAGAQTVSVTLARRGPVPKVALSPTEILLTEPVQFGPGKTSLRPESEKLLDEVVDLLIHHPELAWLLVEYSVDALTGPGAEELQNLEERSIAVRNYLLQHGIAPERVIAQVKVHPGKGPPKLSFRLLSERQPAAKPTPDPRPPD